MPRLDKDRQLKLEPERINYALQCLKEIGKTIVHVDSTTIKFTHNDHTITLHPYSGWFSGKSVKDGRGINNLLKQISNNEGNPITPKRRNGN